MSRSEFPSFAERTAPALPRTLCAGIGSPHGDDRIGWMIAERIKELLLPGVLVRRAPSPSHLLDWLEDCDRLIIVDACRGAGLPGSVHRWTWPCLTVEELRTTSSSHGFGLAAVLKLAAELGRLPSEVVIWGVEVNATVPSEVLSESVADSFETLVQMIQLELAQVLRV